MHRIITLFTLLLISQFINAQVYVNLNAAGANDGSSWTDAFTDLQDAIDTTNGRDIWLAAGVYTPPNSFDPAAAGVGIHTLTSTCWRTSS